MEISWDLIINYPNYLNLLNLRNHYISQSINRGLAVETNESILESKVMMVVYLQSLGAAELRVLWFQRSPCVRSWVVLLSCSPLVNKENSSSNLVLSLFHVYWLNEYVWLCYIYAFHLTSNIHMHEILLEGFSLCRWTSTSLEALERSGVKEDQA